MPKKIKTKCSLNTYQENKKGGEKSTAENHKKVAASMFTKLPKQAKKSTTVDNGSEFAEHKKIGIKTYFCDPYSSWQKGTNENSNGLIRRYLPKKTDLTTVTQEELNDIIAEINSRPRKCLGFKTAQEAFMEELQTSGVRIPKRM